MEGLQSTGARHDRCVADLHALLLRVARHEVARRAGSLQGGGPEADDVAQQAADDALMPIKSKVDGFRGESRFTTWAYRFVVFEVSTRSDGISGVGGRSRWTRKVGSGCRTCPRCCRSRPPSVRSCGRALRRAIAEDLTDLQRRVFVAIAVNEVPMDAFARELGSNRNAGFPCSQPWVKEGGESARRLGDGVAF